MSRIQKKCFIVSASMHGLLAVVVLFGAALMPRKSEDEGIKRINMIDPKLVTMALNAETKGGDAGENAIADTSETPPSQQQPLAVQAPPKQVENTTPPVSDPPKPKPVEPTPVEPKPTPPVEHHDPPPPKPPEHREVVKNNIQKPLISIPDKPKPKPKPVVKNTKPTKPVEDTSDEQPQKIVKPPKPKLNKDDLKLTTRTGSDDESKKIARDAEKAAADAAAADARAARNRKLTAFNSTLRSLNNNLSPAGLVHLSGGVGGGGPVSINYTTVIFNKYYNAWMPPLTLGDDTAVVTVKVTISRDGNVISSHILRSSGNKLMDRSVQSTLDNVTFIEPFPEGSTERERTVTIEFNLEAKRTTG